jgi:hypothetical protein
VNHLAAYLIRINELLSNAELCRFSAKHSKDSRTRFGYICSGERNLRDARTVITWADQAVAKLKAKGRA